MIDKLEEVERRFDRLTSDLSNPAVIADVARLTKTTRERASLEKLVETFRTYKALLKDIAEYEAALNGSDADLRAMAKDELPALKERKAALDEELKIALLPKDPNDEKNVIIEIRAGAGGDEASLFAEEVMQMYLRYAAKKGWKADILDTSGGNAGGLKDATVTLTGQSVYSSLKYE